MVSMLSFRTLPIFHTDPGPAHDMGTMSNELKLNLCSTSEHNLLKIIPRCCRGSVLLTLELNKLDSQQGIR